MDERVPAIHVGLHRNDQNVDARHKAGPDEGGFRHNINR